MKLVCVVPSIIALVTLAACDTADGPIQRVPASVVVEWNEQVLRIAEAEDAFLTLKGLRTVAMMHLAMHDALVAIDPRYRPYVTEGMVMDADPVTAVNEAGYAVAVSQYPDRRAEFDVLRRRWSDATADPARQLGARTAEAVLAARASDGWDGETSYQWHPMGPGVYAEFNEHSGTPEGFVFGAGWANARPFMLSAPDAFRSDPPPEIGSAAYASAFNEVKDVGARTSDTRTEDQAHLAMWWKQFVEKSHNRLGRELVLSDSLDIWDAARFFALLNMSIYDGYIASFDSKFLYNHWRPYTAIRWAASDGNPNTEEDEDWTNLHDHTYAFPSYPSAHGTVCAAAMTVFSDVFGADRPFTMTIREVDSAGPMSAKLVMDPATRSFDNFAAAAEECALSRVYLGIHFRYDSEAGTVLGRKVGEKAVNELLTSSLEKSG